MVKVDLKAAYFMVPIREEDRAFITFSFSMLIIGKYIVHAA